MKKTFVFVFKNVFSLSYWEILFVFLPVLEKENSIIYRAPPPPPCILKYALTLLASNSQFNWSYLLGVNQEDSVCINKEDLKLYSYNL